MLFYYMNEKHIIFKIYQELLAIETPTSE